MGSAQRAPGSMDIMREPAPVVRRSGKQVGRETVIVMLVLLGFAFSMIGLLELHRTAIYDRVVGYSSSRLEYSPAGSSLANYCRFFSGLAVTLAGVLALARNPRMRGNQGLLVLMGVIGAVSLVWFVITYADLPQPLRAGLLAATSPAFWMTSLCIFAGREPAVWRLLDRWSWVIAVGCLGVSILGMISVGEYIRIGGRTPIIVGLAWGFWFSIYFAFANAALQKRRALIGDLLILGCAFVAVFMQSRGWVLQCVLALGIRWLLISARVRGSTRFLRVVVAVTGFVIVAGAGAWLVTSRLSESTEQLASRAMQDTRSGQYHTYFANVELWRLVLGYGPNAAYTIDSDGQPYGYIDNQYLYIALKYGLVTLAAYAALVLLPGVRLAFKRIPVQYKTAGYVILLWCISHAGFSVFCGVGFEPNLYLMFLLGGKCHSILLGQDAGAARRLVRTAKPGQVLAKAETPGSGQGGAPRSLLYRRDS